MLLLFGKTYCYYATDEESGKSGAFKFKIVSKHGLYRAYVIERPPLGMRSCSLNNVHMLRDGKKYYVCVTCDIRSYEKMEAVARLWARRYMRYIATGKEYNDKS